MLSPATSSLVLSIALPLFPFIVDVGIGIGRSLAVNMWGKRESNNSISIKTL